MRGFPWREETLGVRDPGAERGLASGGGGSWGRRRSWRWRALSCRNHPDAAPKREKKPKLRAGGNPFAPGDGCLPSGCRQGSMARRSSAVVPAAAPAGLGSCRSGWLTGRGLRRGSPGTAEPRAAAHSRPGSLTPRGAALSLPRGPRKGAAVFVFEKRPLVPFLRLDPLWCQWPCPENSDHNGTWSPEKRKGQRKSCPGKIKELTGGV